MSPEEVGIEGTWRPDGLIQRFVPATERRGRAACGTDGGYYRHVRLNREPACGPCLAAHAEYERARAQRRREAS